jgi:subtilisin family serine protease
MIPQLELSSGKAPLFANEENAKYIPGEYIVVFKDDVDVDAEIGRAERGNAIKAKFKYRNAFKGFSASIPTQALEGLLNNPKISFIEQNQEVYLISTSQQNATWGIDRIDQNSLPLNKIYNYTNNGSGVTAYIFDTGIRFMHDEFASGRAVLGRDVFGSDGNDENGHGTHVAGTVGGATYGVAKNVKLVAVRVLNASGSGTLDGVIAGLDWAISDHVNFPAVGNMSLGSSASSAVDLAVNNAINDGIVMCVAAGNSRQDASRFSPARVANAITVGATTSTDVIASYSNFGSIVDILAPGSSITSSWYTSNSALNTISGTSMATPHVAGVAALYLQSDLTASPATVRDWLVKNATLNKITKLPRGTANRLLFKTTNL